MTELDPLRWRALAVVAAAFVMTVIDLSIVNVALPSIGKALDFSQGNLQWVITAYAIAYGGFVLLGGRLADTLGRRRVFLTGVGVFTLASFFCGIAWTDTVLIASRAVQGLSAAVIAPAALSIVMTTFPEGSERNRAMGVWGAIGGSGAAIGVLLGGVLTRYLGWEWIFFVNLPIGVLVLLIAPRFVREGRSDEKVSLDLAGAATVTAGLALLVYAISKAPDNGWGSTTTISFLAAAAAFLVAFVAIELRVKHPLVPFRIFRVGNVLGADLTALFVGAVIFGNFFLLTLYTQQVLRWSALRAGLAFVAIAGAGMVFAGIAQALVTRLGPKPVLTAGMLAMTGGMVWLSQIPVHSSYWSNLLPGYLLVGVAMPLSFIPLSIAATTGVERDEAGLASGLWGTAQQIGGAVGVAVVSSVWLSRFTALMRQNGPRSFPESFTSGVQLAFWVCAGIAAAGLVVTLALVHRTDATRATETAEAVAR